MLLVLMFFDASSCMFHQCKFFSCVCPLKYSSGVDSHDVDNMQSAVPLACSAATGSNVTVNAVHPGVVKTDAHKYMPFSQNAFLRISLLPIMWMVMKHPLDGAQTVIYAAVAKEEEGVSGKLYS